MNQQEREELRDVIDDAARQYFPISRINFSQVVQALMAAGIIYIGAEFKKLGDKAIQRETEITSLKQDIKELKDEVVFLRQLLYSQHQIPNGNRNKE